MPDKDNRKPFFPEPSQDGLCPFKRFNGANQFEPAAGEIIILNVNNK